MKPDVSSSKVRKIKKIRRKKRNRKMHDRMCSHGRKRRYRSKAKAMRAARLVRSHGKLHAYKCPNCHDWHLTKKKPVENSHD